MFGAKAAADKYVRLVAQKTGLQPEGDRLAGVFQGLRAWTQTQMVTDLTSAAMGGGGLLGGLGAALGGSTGGMVTGMTGGEFLMKHDYVIELPDYPLPGASLRESTSFLVSKGLQQRPAIGERTSCGVPWIDKKYEVCTRHPDFLRYSCASPELQEHLRKWPYLNLSWDGTQVWLELLDSTVRIHSKFGTPAMSNGDMVLQGLSLAAAAARATFPR